MEGTHDLKFKKKIKKKKENTLEVKYFLISVLNILY